MNYSLHITRTAERDIQNAAEYIALVLKNPQAADSLLDEAEKQIDTLPLFPKKHPLAEDTILASWEIRFIQVKNYLAFYTVSDELHRVTVVRFLHEKSSWSSILKRGIPLI